MILGVCTEPFGRQDRLDDFFHHAFLEIFHADVRVMLRRQDHRVDAYGFVVFVDERDLTFSVGSQPGQGACLANLGLAPDEAVRVGDRRRHQHVGLVGGVAEHQALVTGALTLGVLAVDSLCDIGRLFAERIQYRAGRAVESHVGMRIANIQHRFPRNFFDVDHRRCSDLARDEDHAGLDQGFTGDPCLDVLLEYRVEYGVRNLVGYLVGMSLGHGFRGKQIGMAHRELVLWR